MGKKKRVRAQASAEAELDIMKGSGKKYGKNESEGKWKKPVSIIAAVLAVVLILGVFAWYYIPESGIVQKNQTVMKSEHYTVTTAMCEYLFNSSYYSYAYSAQSYLQYLGLDLKKDLRDQTFPQSDENTKTWYDYFMNSTYSQFKNMLVLCEAALADTDYTVDDDSIQKTVDDAINSMKEVASENNITLQYYFSHMYGSHTNEKIAREVLKLSALATEYQEELTSRYNFTESDWDTYYSENLKDFLKVDYLKYEFTYDSAVSALGDDAEDEEKAAAEAQDKKSAEEVKEIAEKAMECKTEDEFNAYVYDYIRNVKYKDQTDEELEEDEVDVQALVDKCKTSGVKQGTTESDLYTWLYDTSRKANDTYMETDDDGHCTVYMILPATDTDAGYVCQYRDSYNLVTYDYLKYKVSDYDNADEAKKIAESTLADFKEDPTLEKFEALENAEGADYSADSVNDGVKGSVATVVDEWAYDSARAEGDFTLVNDDEAYYIVYFKSTGMISWQKTANDSLVDKAYDEEYEKLAEKYTNEQLKASSAISGLIEILDLSGLVSSDTTSSGS